MTSELATIRKVCEGDFSLIFNSWQKDSRQDYLGLDPQIYYKSITDHIKAIMKKSSFFVACDPQDPNHIYAWLCYQKINDVLVIHYCYTKKAFRNFGFQKRMVERTGASLSQPIVVTYQNRITMPIIDKHDMIYKPELRTA